MKLDMNKPVLDLHGDPIKIKERDWSMKEAISDALMRQYDVEKLTGDIKLARYSLAMEIFKSNGEIDLKAEQIVTIKQVACLAYAPLVYGRICEAVDGDEDKDE